MCRTTLIERFIAALMERLIAATLTKHQPSRRAASDRCGNPGPRRDALSTAGFLRTSRSDQHRGGWGGGRETVRRTGLTLLVTSALTTLSVLLGVTLTDDAAATTSTPLLASTIINVAAATPHTDVQDVPTNQLASTGGRGDPTRSDAMAAGLGFMGITSPPPLDDRRSPDAPTADVARMIAEAFGAGADSAGSGVHGGSVSSAGLAILLALAMLPDCQLPRRICTDYLCHPTWIFSRPLVRPG